MNTLDLNEAADFLHMHPEEVRARAKRGIIPGAKAGRRWVFIDDDLANYLRSLYHTPRQALRVTTIQKEDLCHLLKEETSGGSISQRQMASEYDDLLRPKTKPKRKNFTTN
jgi:hypothetical protein